MAFFNNAIQYNGTANIIYINQYEIVSKLEFRCKRRQLIKYQDDFYKKKGLALIYGIWSYASI